MEFFDVIETPLGATEPIFSRVELRAGPQQWEGGISNVSRVLRISLPSKWAS